MSVDPHVLLVVGGIVCALILILYLFR